MIAKGFKMFDKALPNLKEEVVSIVAEENRVVCEVLETEFSRAHSGAADILGYRRLGSTNWHRPKIVYSEVRAAQVSCRLIVRISSLNQKFGLRLQTLSFFLLLLMAVVFRIQRSP